MRFFLFIFIFQLFFFFSSAQVFWTENFNNGCIAACSAIGYNGGNGAWAQTITGAQGADANAWFVSCAENGNAVGTCGSGCGANATLHLSAKIGNFICPNDCGAAYDAGGLCGLLSCPQTNKRIESPFINCSGQTGINLNFTYIENGQGATDNATVWYFDGTSWVQISDPAKTATGCGGQGIWTSTSIPLPASANNNPNVKIGFRWVNNDDGVGTDPSIAIDNVTLSVPVILPIDLVKFEGEALSLSNKISWTLQSDEAYFELELERSEDALNFTSLMKIKSQHKGNSLKDHFDDKEIKRFTEYYYRLKITDAIGITKHSPIIRIQAEEKPQITRCYFDGESINVEVPTKTEPELMVRVLDVAGKVAYEGRLTEMKNNKLPVLLEKGIYFVKIGEGVLEKLEKIIVW